MLLQPTNLIYLTMRSKTKILNFTAYIKGTVHECYNNNNMTNLMNDEVISQV